MLYLVPTPIGNLDDMTFRAINILNDVDVILSEDTRTSGKLLKHFNIDKPLWSFHAFNEHKALKNIIDHLEQGKNIALISDAGTPGISDPGFLLVRECKAVGIQVSCLPGATAFVPALVSSGMTTDKFYFEGFLPHKKGRQTRWKYLSTLDVTIVIYESPHRLLKCLEEIKIYLGQQRKVCVAREISKMFEEFNTLPVDEAIAHYTNKPAKGEIVIIIEGRSKDTKDEE
jgi:16S rRNA (cytidine1402-2'-O)-methyltransferase